MQRVDEQMAAVRECELVVTLVDGQLTVGDVHSGGRHQHSVLLVLALLHCSIAPVLLVVLRCILEQIVVRVVLQSAAAAAARTARAETGAVGLRCWLLRLKALPLLALLGRR